jgi:hypothetical protein
MALLEDEDTQIKGIVDVIYSIGTADVQLKTNFSHFFSRGVPMLVHSLPMRVSSMHFCYDDPRLRPVMSLIQMVAGKQTRLRCRTHYGENCSYLCGNYGHVSDIVCFARF